MDLAPGMLPVNLRQRLAAAAQVRRSLEPARAARNLSQHPEEMSKRQRTSGPETQTTMMDSVSAVLKFSVNYEQTRHLAVGESVHSDAFAAGGHMWRINFYPGGKKVLGRGSDEHMCISVELLSKSRNIMAVFESILIHKVCESMFVQTNARVHVFEAGGDSSFGYDLFVSRSDLVRHYVTDGQITFVCSVIVLEDNSILVPPSDIGKDLGTLLDSTDGVDVSFTVDGEKFHAHRAVLAARSEVFKAELLGSMAEATMPSINLHDIAPATFRAMLRFIYTDALPAGSDELGGDTLAGMFENLLAAADRYALDRLKLLCAQKLWDGVSVDTVADALACAEIYNCPELRNKCIDFVVAEENFKKAVLTDGFMQLGQKFPSIVAEVRKRVGI